MAYVRKNVYELGDDWAPEILWYARGVAAMKQTLLADRLGWRFYGAIHGFYKEYWEAYGFLTSRDIMPSAGDIDRFWNQCQHGSWYFLPWHRGYLISFEATVRAQVENAGGPKDWALPYWNYFKDNQNRLPPAFDTPDWPDGVGNNPLYAAERFGPQDDGDVYIPLDKVNLKAMNEPHFTGVTSGGSRGFGGVDTGWSHGGKYHGQLEMQPHDMVHVLVGGKNPRHPIPPGLMSTPPLAALDPIFWLHHANIDRLWEAWIKNPPTHTDPTEQKWLQGPPKAYAVPMPNGTAWTFTPGDVNDLSTLNYTYDSLVPGAGASKQGVTAMAGGNHVELVGANRGPLQLTGPRLDTSVELDPGVLRKVLASLSAAAKADSPEAAAHDRVFLNLENVRGEQDATAFSVYVALPPGEDPANHPERLAGSAGLFGVSEASRPDQAHGGEGISYAMEITKIIDALYLENSSAGDTLDVRLVPLNPVTDEANITIGRVSIFRQGR